MFLTEHRLKLLFYEAFALDESHMNERNIDSVSEVVKNLNLLVEKMNTIGGNLEASIPAFIFLNDDESVYYESGLEMYTHIDITTQKKGWWIFMKKVTTKDEYMRSFIKHIKEVDFYRYCELMSVKEKSIYNLITEKKK